jgi:hypothetical protein
MKHRPTEIVYHRIQITLVYYTDCGRLVCIRYYGNNMLFIFRFRVKKQIFYYIAVLDDGRTESQVKLYIMSLLLTSFLILHSTRPIRTVCGHCANKSAY